MKSTLLLVKKIGNHLWPRRWHPFTLASRSVCKAARNGILTGPFAGMRYLDKSFYSALLPKLLGIYELELAGVIEDDCHHGFKTIIDVGAAEGYYAVGMARRCPDAEVHAFEASPEGREMMQELVSLNDCADRVHVHGLCAADDLQQLLQGHPDALLIMDVEGAENDLLNPDRIPEFSGCRILVELHEFAVRGIGGRLRERFARTHTIREYKSMERRIEELPVRSLLLDRWLLKLAREFRPGPMSWYDLEPKQFGKVTP